MAATENAAVCPAVTAWVAGWVVIEGTAGVVPLVLDASPEQPVETTPSYITTRTEPNDSCGVSLQVKSPRRVTYGEQKRIGGRTGICSHATSAGTRARYEGNDRGEDCK